MKFSKEIMKGAAEIIVLQVLKEEGELYGYQLIKSISSTSKGIFEFQEGTLYPLLYRLEFKGDITSTKKIGPNGKERRYYAITAKGKKLLSERKVELHSFVSGIKHILQLSA